MIASPSRMPAKVSRKVAVPISASAAVSFSPASRTSQGRVSVILSSRHRKGFESCEPGPHRHIGDMPRREPRDRLRHRRDMRGRRAAAAAEDIDLTLFGPFAHQLRGRVGQLVIFPEFRSEEHTSELQSLMRISYAVFCLKKKKIKTHKYSAAHSNNKN